MDAAGGNVEDRRSIGGRASRNWRSHLRRHRDRCVITLLSGGNIETCAQRDRKSGLGLQDGEAVETAEDHPLADFASAVLAGALRMYGRAHSAEQGWGEYHQPPENGVVPRLLCSRSAATDIAGRTPSTARQTAPYTSTLTSSKKMETDIGSGGDFAFAYGDCP